jgi:outer membrane protein
MKLLLQLTSALLLFTSILYGQGEKPLSMEEAVQTALDNRTEYQVNKLQEQIAAKQTEVVRFGKIPKIYGDYDLQRNLIIPTTPVPAKAFDPSAPDGELTPLQFSTNWTSGAGINASIDLYNPALNGKVAEAELQEDISETESQITKNKIKYSVRSAYVAALIAQEQWNMAVADTASKSQLLDMTLLQHASGRINDVQLNIARNALTQAKVNLLNALRIFESSKIDLVVQMGMDPAMTRPIILTDSIPDWVGEDQLDGDHPSQDLDLKKINQQQNLNRVQAGNLRKTALPTVTLSGFLGANYYENNFNLWKGEDWYGNSYLKVGVHIPITEGMDRNKKIEVLDLERQILEQQYSEKGLKKQQDLMKTEQDLKYTKKGYMLQKKRMGRNEADYKTALRQFDAGRVLINQVIESDFQYRQAKSDYLQALYDYVKAKIEWTRIVGID